MDRRERKTTQEEVLRAAMQGNQSRLWTALVGVIQVYNPALRTCTVQPAVNGRALQTNGTWLSKQMPLLTDCPVLFQGGGGVTLTFPIAKGDECLVVIASRCIDTWYQHGFSAGGTADAGGTLGQANLKNDPPEFRMHNLSDGFVLAGVRSLPRAIAADPVNACLFSDDGQAQITLNPTTHAIGFTTTGALSINAAGGITMNGATIDASGNVSFPGTFAATGITTGGGINLDTHTHTSESPGSPTSPPLP
jgi:hypothetical protein